MYRYVNRDIMFCNATEIITNIDSFNNIISI